MKLARTIATVLVLCTLSAAAAADGLEASLRRHVNHLSSPALAGRKAGSEGEKMAADYIYKELEDAGVVMLTGPDGDTFTIITAAGDTIASRNIVGILPGSDPALKEEYIVVGAHMDHLGSYTVNVDGELQERIYPGADANASGAAALLETARILHGSPEATLRSVLFVAFGAGEEEFSGSRYFALAGGFSYIGSVKMMINLDMLGRGGADNPFEVYTAMPHQFLNSLMSDVRQNESITAQPALHNGFVFPSDNLTFKQAEIANLTFSTGVSREYRTLRDTPDLISYNNLAAETVYIAAFVKTLANRESLSVQDSDGGEPDKIYSIHDCDTEPHFFRKGVQSFLDDWVYKYLKYPQDAVAAGIAGKVMVSFIIEADGNVSNVTIEKGVSESLDAEALKVVSASPKWKPGVIDGKKVRVKVVIPVEYRLKKR
ncbi:MAG: TonB family protein [Bacteroidales bacterium]|nr:TonB family protein [Bacteroidales bacterium]